MSVRRLAALLIVAVTAVTAGAVAHHDRAPGPARRTAAVAAVVAPDGADIMFAEMMIVHHGQAVRMSRTLIAKPGIPERVDTIAEFIVHDQQREIDEMNAWLRAWGRPAVDPADPAVQRRHGGAGDGMLTDAQLRALGAARGDLAARLYLREMIDHHRGAITMARSLLEGGGRNVFTHGVAKHVINEQTAENDAMRALLTTDMGRSATPGHR